MQAGIVCEHWGAPTPLRMGYGCGLKETPGRPKFP
jgi:hypothetical protein